MTGYRVPGTERSCRWRRWAQAARTVHGVPEVKVSGRLARLRQCAGHFYYIDRHGRLLIETGKCVELAGRDTGEQLVEDWNLALSRGQY